MLKQICYNGWLPVMILFALGTISVTEYLKFTIGYDEMNWLLMLFLFYSFALAFLQFAKQYSKYLIAFNVLSFAILFLILGYSSLPEQQIERARDHYYVFEDYDYSSIKKDNLHAVRVDYVKREQRARKLELEAAELRYYGPTEFYGFTTWQYIFLFSVIGLLTAYAICWFIYLSKLDDGRPSSGE
jgi:hypothetical protein